MSADLIDRARTVSARVPALPIDRPAAVLGLAGFVVMAGTQIAVPLASEQTALTSIVIVGFALASLGFAADRWGPSRSLGAFAFVTVTTLGLERLGSTTGFPFGEYDYTGELDPTIGDVPLVVPVAWFAMGLPALEVAGRVATGRIARIGAAAVALTAWDLFLDPQMVDEGYWTWASDGAYFGIPLVNYLGWLGSGVLVLGVVDAIVGGARGRPSSLLLCLYTWWAAMSAVGLVVFFGLPGPGLVGGAVMGTIAVVAWRSSR